MPSVISGDANVSATEFGFLDGVTSALQSQLDSKLNLAGGKILQIVRATDATERTTTSSSFVDITGLSVTITPQKSNSAILLILAVQVRNDASGGGTSVQITDAANTPVAGAVETIVATGGDTSQGFITCIAYHTPATTSATTYKGRFRRQAGTGNSIIRNNLNTGQIYAIEVSA